uniref:NADH dehydrogenase [ubiquinone] iron-sulfur protein 5 n=1 Tax=Albugo laibachii Nc14 TaxID=890382 RepID=F0W9R3_9STRA|nr:hypothetical protein PITG_19772 [Albugo laibachii Nc14]|eukprot:CCA17881.1 hypothetical protein PITG_19772 [Albugo laibachii Nc14]
MASGFGFNGREGRCYQFWKEVEECNKHSEYLGQCALQAEDYMECLHHRKELTRMNAVVVEKKRQQEKKRNGEHTHGGGH